MAVLKVFVLAFIVAVATAELGTNTDINEWAYQWYLGDPFKFTYAHPNDTVMLTVYWETPTKRMIRSTVDDGDFIVTDAGNVENGAIQIRKLTVENSGVYICHVYADNDFSTEVNRTIFGINVHEPLYRSMNDKYRDNVVVAVIATAVFIVPLLTICFTYKFRYEERHGMTKNNRKYAYTNNGHEMKQDIASTVQAEFGAYENENFKSSSTNL